MTHMISEKQREILTKEYQMIIDESNKKEYARIEELKKAELWASGLDGDSEQLYTVRLQILGYTC